MIKLITRADYMKNHSKEHDEIGNGSNAHNEYYKQFVNDEVIDLVERRIGVNDIKNSTDPHMNDIPLIKWDEMHSEVMRLTRKMRDLTGEGNSLSSTACITKAAARMIKEKLK